MLKQNKVFNDALEEFNAACDGLLCAINDNPDQLNDVKYVKAKIQHHRAVAHMGIIGVSLGWLFKVLGHH